MKTQMLKAFLYVLLSFWLTLIRANASELWLTDIPVKQLQDLYQQCDYNGVKGYLMLPSRLYPKLFLKKFPADYNTLDDETKRNALFIKILAPLMLKLNEDLLAERQEILDIASRFKQNSTLSASDIQTLETKSAKYDVFTRLQKSDRAAYQIAELLNRIDRIPPSIMITAAAIETNWGTSRIVKEANSLYKTYVWHTDEGIKPLGETTDDSYRIKIYPNIYASIEDFALKINSHKVFAPLRNFRRERRERTNNISGLLLAPYIYGYSPLPNYAGLFDYTLAYYELLEIDKSTLSANMIPPKTVKKFQRYVTKM